MKYDFFYDYLYPISALITQIINLYSNFKTFCFLRYSLSFVKCAHLKYTAYCFHICARPLSDQCVQGFHKHIPAGSLWSHYSLPNCSGFCHHTSVVPVPELHRNIIIQYVLFVFWFLSLNGTFLGFIQVVEWSRRFSLLLLYSPYYLVVISTLTGS